MWAETWNVGGAASPAFVVEVNIISINVTLFVHVIPMSSEAIMSSPSGGPAVGLKLIKT
jgi:hypothetical protein